MSWVTGELVTGGWTTSNYAGHGILFENLPDTGEQGGSPLLNDGGVNGDEVRWGPAAVTSGAITVTLFEDGSFESTGGAGSFTYPWWRNGVLQADEQVNINSSGGVISLTMPQFSVSAFASQTIVANSGFTMPHFTVTASAENTVPGSGATVSFTMPQFAAAVSADKTVPVFDAEVAFTMPQFSVAATGESFISGNVATVNVTMPQFTVSASASKTTPVISATVSFAMPQFTASVFSGEFDYYNTLSAEITYLAESTEINYTSESTQIIWRA